MVCALEIMTLVLAEWRGRVLLRELVLIGVGQNWGTCPIVTSLQCWLALRRNSLFVALGIGVTGIMSGIIPISTPFKFLSLFPWTASAAAASPQERLFPLIWGMRGGLIFAVLACWRLAVREPLGLDRGRPEQCRNASAK